MFAVLIRLASDEPVVIPPVCAVGATAVVHATAVLIDALRSAEPTVIDQAVVTLGEALDALPPDDPRSLAARAWADLALGGLAVLLGDLRVARHRFEAVALEADGPFTLRLAAMRRLVGLSIERRDFEAARAWARRAVALAEAHDHPSDAGVLVRGLLDYAVGDLPAMRVTLDEAVSHPEHGRIARLLLATSEAGPDAIQQFSDVLVEAVALDDTLMYALCVLLGARCYIAMGRRDDAAATIDAAVEQLSRRAPYLAAALLDERAGWADR